MRTLLLSWGRKIVWDHWVEATENAFGGAGGFFPFPGPFPLTKVSQFGYLWVPRIIRYNVKYLS